MTLSLDDQRHIVAMAHETGFALAAWTPAGPTSHEHHVRQWIARGEHGEMAYLANHLEIRLDPARWLESARSLLMVADVYAPAATLPVPAGAGRIARYAWGDDYHKTIKRRLHVLADAMQLRWPHGTFRSAVDTAPLLEREHGARAQLGWTGKHTLLIHPALGSYLLLGAIATTLPLEKRGHAAFPATMPDHCGTCRRCIEACPTQCIEDADRTGQRSVDATRCISYLTLEHRSPVDPQLFASMGDWLAGCDVCQEVCPHNQSLERLQDPAAPMRPAARHLAQPMAYRPRLCTLDVLELLHWTAEDRARVLRGSALKRMKLEMIQRNALIVAGNLDRASIHAGTPLRQRVEQLAQDPQAHELVRTTARAVLQRMVERCSCSS